MSTVKTYSRNLATCWLAEGAGLVTAFLLMPFILHSLGDTGYGAWSLLLSISGWLTLVDAGLRQSISKYLNEYLARHDHVRAGELISTAIVMLAGAGLLIILLAVLSGGFFSSIFPSLPREYWGQTWIAMILVGINLAIGLQSSLFRRVMEAFNRIDLTNLIYLLNLGIRTSLTVVVLVHGGGLIGLAIAILVGMMIDALAMRAIAFRVATGLPIAREHIRKSEASTLLRFGIPVLLGNMAGMLTGYTTMILVGIFIGVAEVTTYSIGFTLLTYSGQFLRHILRVLTPDLYKHAGIDDKAGLRHLYIRVANFMASACLPLFIGFIFFGGEFIRLWLHREPEDSARVLIILTLGSLSMMAGSPGGVIMIGLGRVRLWTGLMIVQGAASLVLTLIFTSILHWGLPGAALGSAVCSIIISGIVQPVLVCHHIELRLRHFFRRAVLPWSLVGGCFAAACYVIVCLSPVAGWLTFAAKIVALVLLYAPLAWCMLFDRDLRNVIRLTIQPWKRNTATVQEVVSPDETGRKDE